MSPAGSSAPLLILRPLLNRCKEKFNSLLDRFKKGVSEDKALEEVYGFNRDGLEVLWREWVGAAPMQESAASEATPTPTLVPTFAPIVGPSTQASQTPTESDLEPTPDDDGISDEDISGDGPQQKSPDLNPMIIVGIGGGLLLVVVVIVVLRGKRTKQES